MIDKTPEQIIAKAKERGELFGGNANGNQNYVVFTLDEFKAFAAALTAALPVQKPVLPHGGFDASSQYVHDRSYNEGWNACLEAIARSAQPAALPASDVEAAISRIRSYVPASTAKNGFFVDALHEELLAAYAAGAQPTQPAAPANVDALDAAEQIQYLISTGAAIRRQGSGFYLLYEDLSEQSLVYQTAGKAIDAAIAARGAT